MSSQASLYRLRRKLKLKKVFKESPHLQVRYDTHWPGQVVPRNQRIILRSSGQSTHDNIQPFNPNSDAASPDGFPLTAPFTAQHEQTESQGDVFHIQLQFATPNADNIGPAPLANTLQPYREPHETISDLQSSSQVQAPIIDFESSPGVPEFIIDLQSPAGVPQLVQDLHVPPEAPDFVPDLNLHPEASQIFENLQLPPEPPEFCADTQTHPSDIVLPQPRDLTEAVVCKYINNLDIPEGLFSLWTIFRKKHASNVMMGQILHWFRDQQMKLACAISKQSIPQHLKLPLDYRGAHNLLGLSSVFHVDIFCLCIECQKWKPRAMFETPFESPCCRLLPNKYESHFVVYEIHEILQLLLPFYKPKVQAGYYNGCSRLEHMRRTVQGTDEDVYVSIGFDGVPFSPSSAISVYPVLGTIDGLSGQHTKGSTFILALWMGSLTTSKPDVHTLFAPIVAQFNNLATTPMTWVDHLGQTQRSRVFLSTILTDTVARPQVMCLQQFNGTYGCAWCLHERNNTNLWDYKNPDDQAPLRTNDNLRDHLSQLFDEQGYVIDAGQGKNDGIQGRTPFADLHYFDIVQDFPPCTMHANYEGTAKRLLSFWVKKKNQILSGTQQSEIDAFLVSCKPPARITRPPRQLSKLKKAHEHCVWLFYTSPIVLQDHLPSAMYNHYLCLVRGLSLLHKDNPTAPEINTAEQQLAEFLLDYSTHYGSNNKSYNIHILLHLCAFVRQRGPLYRFSLMPMESYNKHIKDLPTGPKYVTMQMCTRFLEETVFKSKKHSYPKEPVQLQYQGFGEHFVSTCPGTFIKDYISTTYGPKSSYFERLRLGGRLLHSLSYSEVTTTNSSCFKIGEGVFFDAHVFVRTPAGFQAVGKVLHGEIFNGIWFIFKCVETDTVSAIDATNLKTVVFKIEYKQSVYISQFLNEFESYAE